MTPSSENGSFGVNFYGSEKLPDSTELVAQFQKIVDNRFARWIMTRMTEQKKFEHILGVFAGVENAHNMRESTQSRVLGAALREL